MSERWENFSAKQKAYIEQMTNWQRSQWARAGYPSNTKHFAEMERPSHAKC